MIKIRKVFHIEPEQAKWIEESARKEKVTESLIIREILESVIKKLSIN